MAADQLFLMMKRYREPEKAKRRAPQYVYVTEQELPFFKQAGFDFSVDAKAGYSPESPEGIAWQLAVDGYKRRAPASYYLGDTIAKEMDAVLNPPATSLLDGFLNKLNTKVQFQGQEIPAWMLAGVGTGAAAAATGGFLGLTALLSDRSEPRKPEQY
ncbi:hypothetical protein [Synechococcus elongatus]|uniref:hypothetical protein n=1 Tax=Synechococcus elongatus TaxID=32046 RepID=UPI000F7EFC73|nr:hypothetical protein [Synechococcus elongatus]